mmetsp:Transcript_22017/g.61201  ORF Transcript_22017/g.61201 Transcript_22017/m.61201 type:complete len:285 (+) Transcript_22017:60-914(+)
MFVRWCLLLLPSCIGFHLVAGRPKCARREGMAHLSATSHDTSSFTIETCSGDQEGIGMLAAFMVDAFWIGSSRQLTKECDISSISEPVRERMVAEQAHDLTEKYGERMGKRLCDSLLMVAKDDDSGALLGMVGLEVTLFDKGLGNILSAEKAESILKNAVASLGPKQRRQYKDASAQQIATELLSPDVSSICCLSNLAVSPLARRRGVALSLCSELESVVKEIEYDRIVLKVEKDNEAARALYENKLGYVTECEVAGETALRANPEAGTFEETTVDSVILSKDL